MSSELLASFGGVVFSLLFSYFPGLSGVFDPLPSNQKRLLMLLVLVATAAGVFGLACIGKYDLVVCSADGAWSLLEYFVFAAIANQTAYKLSPK